MSRQTHTKKTRKIIYIVDNCSFLVNLSKSDVKTYRSEPYLLYFSMGQYIVQKFKLTQVMLLKVGTCFISFANQQNKNKNVSPYTVAHPHYHFQCSVDPENGENL